MEFLFGIYGRCFLAVGDILWAYFSYRDEARDWLVTNPPSTSVQNPVLSQNILLGFSRDFPDEF
jgi:hypothetical protein